jgi:uncharacterized membrane protein
MKTKYPGIGAMLFLSVSFTIVLLAVRVIASGQLNYIFYPWNLLLAAVPLFISRQINKCTKLQFKAILLLLCWLVFFPNAPYIVTDIFHFKERPPLPLWYDLLLVTSAAWNGLIMGIISLLQVEQFLHKHLSTRWVSFITVSCLGLCSFGIYIGRFLRYNSWDVVVNPVDVASSIIYRVRYPFDNLRTWGFTILFSGLLSLVYFTIRKVPLITPAAEGEV